MSLRLSNSILDGVDLPRHPFNGIQALGVLPSGRIVWPIAGGDGTDDDKDKDKDKGGTGGTGDAGGGTGDAGGAGGTGDQGGGGSSGGDPNNSGSSGQVTREEFDHLFTRMQAADRRATDAEKKLRDIEDKDKSELEKAQRDLKDAQELVQTLQPQVREQAIRIAFLTAAGHITWHDPEDALQFAMRELKDVEVKDGNVDRSIVKAAADKLAKEKPYLVKRTDTNDDGGGGGGGPSGDPMNDKDKDKSKLNREKLAEKYPALRR